MCRIPKVMPSVQFPNPALTKPGRMMPETGKNGSSGKLLQKPDGRIAFSKKAESLQHSGVRAPDASALQSGTALPPSDRT